MDSKEATWATLDPDSRARFKKRLFCYFMVNDKASGALGEEKIDKDCCTVIVYLGTSEKESDVILSARIFKRSRQCVLKKGEKAKISYF